MELPLLSVVIPTYNRYHYLLEAVASVKQQTYPNIEIVVVNDKSTDQRYNEYDWKAASVNYIELARSTRDQFGFPCSSHVRNVGIDNSNGTWIAFLDDDDLWLKEKTDYQLLPLITERKHIFSTTDGFWGNSRERYVDGKQYPLYIGETHRDFLLRTYGLPQLPEVWNKALMQKHNGAVTSSIVVQKKLIAANKFDIMPNRGEDYRCWLKCLEWTNLWYVNKPTFYYDGLHGDGRNY